MFHDALVPFAERRKNERILSDAIRERDEFMDFLILLVLRYAVFTIALFSIRVLMHYFLMGRKRVCNSWIGF